MTFGTSRTGIMTTMSDRIVGGSDGAARYIQIHSGQRTGPLLPGGLLPVILATLVPLVVAVPVAVLLWRSVRSRRGIRARPQFTRQQMRQRREEDRE